MNISFNKFKLLIIPALFTFIQLSLAQVQPDTKKLTLTNADDIHTYITSNYNLPRTYLDTVCLNTVAFAKFRVNKAGEVLEIQLNDGTPEQIATAMKAAIQSSNGAWQLSREDYKKTFLLPLVFFYNRGCMPLGDGLTNKNYLPELFAKMNKTAFSANNAVRNMLTFGNKQATAREFVILSPCTFAANGN